jgi:hypothetical protein
VKQVRRSRLWSYPEHNWKVELPISSNVTAADDYVKRLSFASKTTTKPKARKIGQLRDEAPAISAQFRSPRIGLYESPCGREQTGHGIQEPRHVLNGLVQFVDLANTAANLVINGLQLLCGLLKLG